MKEELTVKLAPIIACLVACVAFSLPATAYNGDDLATVVAYAQVQRGRCFATDSLDIVCAWKDLLIVDTVQLLSYERVDKAVQYKWCPITYRIDPVEGAVPAAKVDCPAVWDPLIRYVYAKEAQHQFSKVFARIVAYVRSQGRAALLDRPHKPPANASRPVSSTFVRHGRLSF